MRKKFFTLLFFATCCLPLSRVGASGLPTVDVAAVAQMTAQLVQLKLQYEVIKKQYQSIIGSYGRGEVGLGEAIASTKVVPGTWQDVVKQQKRGEFASKQAYYEKLISTMPQEIFKDPESQQAKTYKLSTDSVRAAMAGGDALYAEMQVHLNNLEKLSRLVDKTKNAKDAQDLQNRIAAENGMVQVSLGKVNTMNMNLQANILNQDNQAVSANYQYYHPTE